jgi:competence protein CoiA
MQLFALDEQGQLLSASGANRGVDYLCLECQGVVRRRSGPHRQPHFYHLAPVTACHLSGKGMAHLQIQCYLSQLLPLGEAFVEHRFPQIGRIADVAWVSRGLIFEIQCSPISSEEIAARNRDYGSLGYQVIWILHDSQFNRRRLSAAEMELEGGIHYFSNMDAEGRGIIYDQFDVKQEGRRVKKLTPLPVDLSQPKSISKPVLRATWPLHFAGDLIDMSDSSAYYQQMMTLRVHFYEKWFTKLYSIYREIFQMLLEWACR